MKETINEALGVTNRRAEEIKALLMANIYVACKKQDKDAGGEAKGYDICIGIKATMDSIKDKAEAYVIGDCYCDMDKGFDRFGVPSFIIWGDSLAKGLTVAEEIAKAFLTDSDEKTGDNYLKN